LNVKTSLPEFSIEKLIALLSTNPRKIFGVETPSIKKDNRACMTLFSEEEWTFTDKHIQSKSINTPFLGKKFTGRPWGIINKDQLFLNEDF
jgi:dihydroorotase